MQVMLVSTVILGCPNEECPLATLQKDPPHNAGKHSNSGNVGNVGNVGNAGNVGKHSNAGNVGNAGKHRNAGNVGDDGKHSNTGICRAVTCQQCSYSSEHQLRTIIVSSVLYYFLMVLRCKTDPKTF